MTFKKISLGQQEVDFIFGGKFYHPTPPPYDTNPMLIKYPLTHNIEGYMIGMRLDTQLAALEW